MQLIQTVLNKRKKYNCYLCLFLIYQCIVYTILVLLLQVAFFTNQMGIAKGKLRPEVFKSKVEDILTTLQLAVQVDTVETRILRCSLLLPDDVDICLCLVFVSKVFIASGPGLYRKPVMGMWNYLCDKVKYQERCPSC